jgi:hypothetical protein
MNLLQVIKNNRPRRTFWIVILILLIVSFVADYLVRTLGVNHIVNNKPFGIAMPAPFSSLILLGIFTFLYFSSLMKKYSFSSAFILAGAGFNFFERMFLGGAKDYISIFVGYINLSDILLWFGLVFLNYEFWFKTIQVDENSETLERVAKVTKLQLPAKISTSNARTIKPNPSSTPITPVSPTSPITPIASTYQAQPLGNTKNSPEDSLEYDEDDEFENSLQGISQSSSDNSLDQDANYSIRSKIANLKNDIEEINAMPSPEERRSLNASIPISVPKFTSPAPIAAPAPKLASIKESIAAKIASLRDSKEKSNETANNSISTDQNRGFRNPFMEKQIDNLQTEASEISEPNEHNEATSSEENQGNLQRETQIDKPEGYGKYEVQANQTQSSVIKITKHIDKIKIRL